MPLFYSSNQIVKAGEVQRKLGEISQRVKEEDFLIVFKNSQPDYVIIDAKKFEKLLDRAEEQLDQFYRL